MTRKLGRLQQQPMRRMDPTKKTPAVWKTTVTMLRSNKNNKQQEKRKVHHSPLLTHSRSSLARSAPPLLLLRSGDVPSPHGACLPRLTHATRPNPTPDTVAFLQDGSPPQSLAGMCATGCSAASRCMRRGSCFTTFGRRVDYKLYFADMPGNANRIAGTLHLQGASMFLAYYAEYDFCLEVSVVSPSPRHYYMYAVNRAELRSWMRHLALAGVKFVCPTTNNDEVKMLLSDPASEPCVYGMQGFMEKRGNFRKAFKRRFFRIERDSNGDQVVGYYANYDDVKAKGYIALKGSTVETVDVTDSMGAKEKEGKMREFHVVTANRTFVMRPTTVKEKQIWVSILKNFAKYPSDAPRRITIAGFPRDQKEDNSSDSEPEQEESADQPGSQISTDVAFTKSSVDMRVVSNSGGDGADVMDSKHASGDANGGDDCGGDTPGAAATDTAEPAVPEAVPEVAEPEAAEPEPKPEDEAEVAASGSNADADAESAAAAEIAGGALQGTRSPKSWWTRRMLLWNPVMRRPQ